MSIITEALRQAEEDITRRAEHPDVTRREAELETTRREEAALDTNIAHRPTESPVAAPSDRAEARRLWRVGAIVPAASAILLLLVGTGIVPLASNRPIDGSPSGGQSTPGPDRSGDVAETALGATYWPVPDRLIAMLPPPTLAADPGRQHVGSSDGDRNEQASDEVAPSRSAEDAFSATVETAPPPGDYRLQGIMLGGDAPMAIINGSVIRIGQTIAGAELVAVHAGGAKLRVAARTFDVPLTRTP